MPTPLDFSSDSKSRFTRWAPVREELDQTFNIYRLFVDLVTTKDKDRLLLHSSRESEFDHKLRVSLAYAR